MEAESSHEILLKTYKTTQCHNPEYPTLNSKWNLKQVILIYLSIKKKDKHVPLYGVGNVCKGWWCQRFHSLPKQKHVTKQHTFLSWHWWCVMSSLRMQLLCPYCGQRQWYCSLWLPLEGTGLFVVPAAAVHCGMAATWLVYVVCHLPSWNTTTFQLKSNKKNAVTVNICWDR